MKPGDQVIPAGKVGRLHLSEESLIEHAFFVEPGQVGIVLDANKSPQWDPAGAQVPIWTHGRFPVKVLFGVQVGWCLSHEIEVINETRRLGQEQV